ncbi:MAG: helix-turn-helix transcriptional regulator [Candidatus Thermoplasmatota archaeon]
MGRTVKGDSVGARILLLLGERYPITLGGVALALGMREDSIRRELAKLASAGLVLQEDLDGTTYVTLTGAGVTYVGLSPKDVARLRSRKAPPAKPRDDNDPAFI